MALYPDATYTLVNTSEKLDAMLEGMKAARFRSIDTETSGLSVLEDYITGISLSWQEGQAYYIPVNHKAGTNLSQDETIAKLRPSFEDPHIINIAHGKKFDSIMLAALDLEASYIKDSLNYATDLWLTAYARELGIRDSQFDKLGLSVTFKYDTMVLAYLTGKYARIGTGRSTASLKKIAAEELGIEMVFIEELFQTAGRTRKKSDRIHFEELDPDENIDRGGGKFVKPYEYACADSDMTLRLFNRLLPKVKDLFLTKVDHGVIPLTKLMELNGVTPNVDKMNSTYKRLTCEANRVQQLVYRDVGDALGFTVKFDLASPTQVGDILFGKLGYPVVECSAKTGKPLTNAKVLDVMSRDYPLVANILTWRSLRKAAEEFFLGMQQYISPTDSKIHCSYATAHVSSGRYACENPNFQNQPRLTKWRVYDKELPDIDAEGNPVKKSDEGFSYYEIRSNLRRCYEAIPDFYMLDGDYSQIEYKVFAGRSQARALLNAYRDGADLHTRNASMIFGIPESDVTKALRTEAKTYSFGIMYGMAAGGIALRTGRTKAECQQLYDRYFEAIPEGKQHIRDITDAAKRDGYVTTHFGRVVHIPELQSDNRNVRFKGEREAFNISIQGTAADILRIAICRLTKQLIATFGPRFNDKVKPILTTHDSITLMVHKSIHPDTIIEVMKAACEVKIKNFPDITADFAVGPNYGELVEWGKLKPTWNPAAPDLGAGGELVTLGEEDEFTGEVACEEVVNEVTVGSVAGNFSGGPVELSKVVEVASASSLSVEVQARQIDTYSGPGPVPDRGEAQTFSLHIMQELLLDQAQALKELLVHNPGGNLITLMLPDGEIPMTGCLTSLGKEQESLFQVIVPCKLVSTTIDKKSLLAGIKF